MIMHTGESVPQGQDHSLAAVKLLPMIQNWETTYKSGFSWLGCPENLIPLGPHSCLAPFTWSMSFLSIPRLTTTGDWVVTPDVGQVHILTHVWTNTASLIPASHPA